MPFYAEIDESNICIGISDLSGKVQTENMLELEIDSYDISLIGKRWNGKSWETLDPEPAPILETTAIKLSRLESQILILMDVIADLYEELLPDKGQADLYAALVAAGRRTINDIPEKLKDAVQAGLKVK